VGASVSGEAGEATRQPDDGVGSRPGDGALGRPTRVLIADDQRVVREGLAMLLDLLGGVEVVGTAEDGERALELVRELQPDVVLMDLRMPRCDGVRATARLREQAPSTRVLVLTTYADDRSVLDALRAGARGFLTKDAGAEQIEAALAAVMRGEAAIDPAVAHHLVEAVASGAPPRPERASAPELPDGITPREAQVLELIAGGLSNAEIAQRLVVTEATVKSHINHLFTKTGVRDRAQAVAYAYRNGLAPSSEDAS
jgi:DNA-binding NarL/FixJ family response regulator